MPTVSAPEASAVPESARTRFVGRPVAWALRRPAQLLLAVFLAVLALQWTDGVPHVSGDTQTLVSGAQVILDCVGAGELVGCEAEPPPLYTTIGPYPPFQYLPAVAVLGAGATTTTALDVLWYLSMGSLVGLLGLLWLTAARIGMPAWGPALAVLVLTGPLLFYANSTFGEMLATFLIALFTAAALLRAHWTLLAASAWLAGMTKETAAPILIALALIALFGTGAARRRPARPVLAGLALGLVLAVATNALLNVLRYGTLTNVLYLDVAADEYGLEGVPVAHRLDFFAALLVSPNGGLAPFWPAAVLLLAGVAICGVRSRREGVARWWPAAALVGIFLALNAGFASYFTPFGWQAWGPRYTIPWVPALALLAVAAYGDELGRLAGRLLRFPLVLLAGCGALVAFALPHLGVVVSPAAFATVFAPDDRCGPLHTLRGEHYLDCVSHVAWARPPALLDGLEVLSWPGDALLLCSFGIACLALLGLFRARLERPMPARGGPRQAETAPI